MDVAPETRVWRAIDLVQQSVGLRVRDRALMDDKHRPLQTSLQSPQMKVVTRQLALGGYNKLSSGFPVPHGEVNFGARAATVKCAT